jgi:hypothetical protein
MVDRAGDRVVVRSRIASSMATRIPRNGEAGRRPVGVRAGIFRWWKTAQWARRVNEVIGVFPFASRTAGRAGCGQ